MGMVLVGEIGMVGGVDCLCDQFVFDEDWFGQYDVGQVGVVFFIGVVVYEDIVWMDCIFVEMVQDLWDEFDEVVQMYWDVFGLIQYLF